MTSSRPEPNFHPQQLSPHCRDLYRPIFRHQDQGRSISARAEVVCVSMFYNCAAQQNDVTGTKKRISMDPAVLKSALLWKQIIN